MNAKIASHANYSDADYRYLHDKGYSDEEILEIWNRDVQRGLPAQLHLVKGPDVVGILNGETR